MIVKTELYDTEVMEALLQSASDGVVYATGRRGNVQRVSLRDYLGPSLQNTGRATVTYELKSGTHVGRYYSATGYQPFPSALRAHLAHRLYYDVDIKLTRRCSCNCAPSCRSALRTSGSTSRNARSSCARPRA